MWQYTGTASPADNRVKLRLLAIKLDKVAQLVLEDSVGWHPLGVSSQINKVCKSFLGFFTPLVWGFEGLPSFETRLFFF